MTKPEFIPAEPGDQALILKICGEFVDAGDLGKEVLVESECGCIRTHFRVSPNQDLLAATRGFSLILNGAIVGPCTKGVTCCMPKSVLFKKKPPGEMESEELQGVIQEAIERVRLF